MNGGAGVLSRLGVLLALATAYGVGEARAAKAERTYSVLYAAPAGCPERGAFLGAIRARAPEATERDADADVSFDVRIAPQGELATGTLTVRFRAGERFAREVPAAPCDDVTTSMAIMAGLLLSGALLPEPAPSVAETKEDADDARTLAPPPPPAPPRPSPPPPPRAPALPPPDRDAAELRLRAGVFVDGRLDFAAAPFPAFGVESGLDALFERGSPLSPSLRVGALYVAGTAPDSPAGSAYFALWAVTLRGCPLRVALGSPFTLGACALFEGGLLTASPRGAPGVGSDAQMTWLALGASGRVEAPLGAGVALEAELAGFGLVHHDDFVLQPGDVSVHAVPVVSGAFSLGAVARWP